MADGRDPRDRIAQADADADVRAPRRRRSQVPASGEGRQRRDHAIPYDDAGPYDDAVPYDADELAYETGPVSRSEWRQARRAERRARRERRRARRGLSGGSWFFLFILLVVAGAVAAALWYANEAINGEPGPGEPVEVVVPQGATAGTIGEQLADDGVVKNALAFSLIARSRNLDSSLSAGRYTFETGMSVDEAIDVLLVGPALPESVRFTVQEGLTVGQTIGRLDEQFDAYTADDFRAVLDERLRAGSNDGDVLQLPDWVPPVSELGPEIRAPLEGLLFPNTYEVFADETEQEVLQTMVDLLIEEMAAIPGAQVEAAEAAGLDRYDMAIIASLIERETRVDAERALVSGVIRNRLEAGMPLQIDATVLYALGEHDDFVSGEDLEVDSPYNTYLNPGLPPTPISGFGRASLQAAFAPEASPYLYYVLAPECDGSHVFAETLEEHNANVAAFREADRCGVETG